MLKKIEKTHLYYISLVLLIFKIYYSTSQIFQIPNILSKTITFTIIILLLGKIYLEKYTLKQWKYIVLIILVAGYTSIRINEYNIILTTLMIIGIKNVDLKKILKVILYSNIVMISLHIVIYIIFLYVNPDFIIFYYAKDGTVRHSFMLGHPNYVSLIIISTYLDYEYLTYYDKKNKMQYIIGILIMILLGFTTRSRTAMLMIGLIMGLFFVAKLNIKKEFKTKTLQKISKYIFATIALVTFFSLCLGSGEYTVIDKKIDNIISGRIWYMEKGFILNRMTILGQGIPYENQGIVLDNLYGKSVINYGVVYLFVLSLLFIENNKNMEDRDNIAMIIFAIYSISEALMTNTTLAIPLLILGDCIFNRSIENGNKERKLSDIISASIQYRKLHKKVLG